MFISFWLLLCLFWLISNASSTLLSSDCFVGSIVYCVANAFLEYLISGAVKLLGLWAISQKLACWHAISNELVMSYSTIQLISFLLQTVFKYKSQQHNVIHNKLLSSRPSQTWGHSDYLPSYPSVLESDCIRDCKYWIFLYQVHNLWHISEPFFHFLVSPRDNSISLGYIPCSYFLPDCVAFQVFC